jgi:hypothetical protein
VFVAECVREELPLHFVIHTPGMAGDVARSEKQLVPHSRPGL